MSAFTPIWRCLFGCAAHYKYITDNKSGIKVLRLNRTVDIGNPRFIKQECIRFIGLSNWLVFAKFAKEELIKVTIMANSRTYSLLDNFLLKADQVLQTIFTSQKGSDRQNPADQVEQTELRERERRTSEQLMRINHAGEASAQGLYLGQAITTRDSKLRQAMHQSASEEADHLNWCQQRVQELGGHTSYLQPLWYMGSLTIGMTAGLCGDKWSLGFLVETERQVVKHLGEHLTKLPKQDHKSRAIIEQMQQDEQEHADKALQAGAAELPKVVKVAMRCTAKIMTTVARQV